MVDVKPVLRCLEVATRCYVLYRLLIVVCWVMNFVGPLKCRLLGSMQHVATECRLLGDVKVTGCRL